MNVRSPLLVVSLIALTLLVTPEAQAKTFPCPIIYSHATQMLDAPENTLPGIDKVPQSTADGVEMDVQWTSSNFPVLMHDATVDRTTNGTGTVASMGLSQVGALSAADYAPWNTWPSLKGFKSDGTPTTPVPYAGDFIPRTAAGNLDMLLDIHATPTQVGMDKLVIYMNRSNWAERTLIMAPPAWVQLMRGWYPDLHYAIIEYPSAIGTGAMRTGEYLQSLGAEVYITPITNFLGNVHLIDYYHSYGIKVFTWTSDNASVDISNNWQAATDKGVDGLITNHPKEARQEVAQCLSTVPTPLLPKSKTSSSMPVK